MQKPPGVYELHHFVRTAQKAPYGKNELSNKLASQFKRSQFCFKLDTLMIVKVNIVINELFCIGECLELRSVNTFCLENRKEIFC